MFIRTIPRIGYRALSEKNWLMSVDFFFQNLTETYRRAEFFFWQPCMCHACKKKQQQNPRISISVTQTLVPTHLEWKKINMIIALSRKKDDHISTRYARNNNIPFRGFITNFHASKAINNNTYIPYIIYMLIETLLSETEFRHTAVVKTHIRTFLVF